MVILNKLRHGMVIAVAFSYFVILYFFASNWGLFSFFQEDIKLTKREKEKEGRKRDKQRIKRKEKETQNQWLPFSPLQSLHFCL